MADGEDDLSGGDDLRSALAAAMVETEANEPSVQEAPQAEKPAVERNRDETGKFAPKPAEKAAPEAQKPDATQKPAETAAPAAATRKAPVSWSKETQPLFDTLPPAIQDQILKREEDAQRGFSQRDERVKLADDFQRAIAPHRDMIARSGFANPVENVQILLNAQAALQANPAKALADIGRTFGFDLSALLQQQPQAQSQAPNPLETKVQQLERWANEQVQREQQQRVSAQLEAINAFATTHPHFEAVEGKMEALIRSGQARGIEDAYDQAVWLDPTIRSQLIAEQTAPAAPAAKGIPDQAAVRRAQAASASVRGAPGGGSPSSVPKDSLREELEAAMRG